MPSKEEGVTDGTGPSRKGEQDMTYLRSIEFDGTNNNVFADAYGEAELLTPAKRIAGVCVRGGVKKLCVPLDPRESHVITLEDMQEAEADSEVMYLLVASTLTIPEEALVMVDDINDPYIAKVYRNQVFIQGDYKSLPNLSLIVKKYVEKAPLYIEADIKKERDKARRIEIGKFIVQDIEARRQNIQTSINNMMRNIEEARANLTQYCNSLDAYHDTMHGIEKRRGETGIDEIMAEIDEILGSSSLKELYVKEGKVHYITGPISITDIKGFDHFIGDSFDISIDMTRSDVRFKNLGNRLKLGDGIEHSIPHPHCNSDGKPCLGNISTVLPEVCSTRDIMGVWQIIHSFLTSYNPSDVWGTRLKYWPATKDGVAVRLDENGDQIV